MSPVGSLPKAELERIPRISDNLPRRAGLDVIVNTILASEKPLEAVFKQFLDLLWPEFIIRFRANADTCRTAEWLVATLASERDRLRQLGIMPDVGMAPELVQAGIDYSSISASKEQLASAFWGGCQTYNFISAEKNAYNPSFVIALFPRPTATIAERRELTKQYQNPEFPRNDEHVKTVLFACKGETHFYLAMVPSEQMVDEPSIGSLLSLSKSQTKSRLRLASEDPLQITGRERGCVGPLALQQKFPNIGAVFIDKTLLEPYTRPHYAFPIDKRSGLIVADTSDLIEVLRAVPGFPRIVTYSNAPTSGQ